MNSLQAPGKHTLTKKFNESQKVLEQYLTATHSAGSAEEGESFPPHLKEEFDQHQVDASVAVQARCTLEETRWLLDFTKQYDHVAGVVGWIDLKDDKLAEVLEEFKDEKNLCG